MNHAVRRSAAWGATFLVIVTSLQCRHVEATPPAVSQVAAAIPFQSGRQYKGPLTMTVMMDASLTPLEEAHLIFGFDSWPTVLGKDNLVLKYGRIEDPDYHAVPEGQVNVVRLGWGVDLEPTNVCNVKDKIGCYRMDTRRIYIAVEELKGNPNHLTATAAHELGHALLGPDHRDPPSVMAPRVDLMALEPQYKDVDVFCRVHGCKL